MNKRVNIFVALVLLVGFTQALFQNQVGVFDWNLKNAGDIEDVIFLAHKIAFKAKDNVIGAISIARGVIDWAKDFSTSKSFIKIEDGRFFVIDGTSKSLSWIDPATGASKGSLGFDLATQDEIVDATLRPSDDKQSLLVAFVTSKEAYLYMNSEHKRTITAEKGSSFVASDIRNGYIGLFSTTQDSLCFQRLPLEGSSTANKTCIKNTDGRFNQAKFRFFDNYVAVEGNDVSATFAYASDKKPTESTGRRFLNNCGVIVDREGDSYKVKKVDSKGSLSNFLTVPVSKRSSFGFACASDATKNNAFYVVELIDGRNLKFKRADLSKSEDTLQEIFERITEHPLTAIDEVFYSFEHDDSRFVIKTETLQTVYISKAFPGQTWKREESLSQIKSVEYFDIYNLEDHAPNPYFEHLDEMGDRISQITTNLILRVKTQVESLTNTLNRLIKIATARGLKALWEETDTDFEAQYGLQKLIFAVTESNTIFGIDSKTGEPIWDKIVDKNWKIERVFKANRGHDAKEAIVYLIHKKDARVKFIHVDPSNGKYYHEEEVEYVPQRIIKASYARHTFLILVQNQDSIAIYPKALAERKDIENYVNGLTLYWINQRDITGYQISGLKLVPVWNFVLSENEEIIKSAHWSYDHEESSFTSVIPEDMKVIYKFLDSNNFAILSKSNTSTPHLNLYVLNGVTGRVLLAKSQGDVDFSQPINLHFDENSIFVTYFNTDIFYYEIWVTEFFRNHIETSFTHLVEKHLFKKVQTDEEEEYNFLDNSFIYFSKKYYFQPGIKKISTVQTKRGITKKNLLIITPTDQVFSLDRGLLSSRRAEPIDGKPPVSDPTSFFSSELPPYVPILPVDTRKYVTYYQRFSGLKNIVSAPTNFESTALILAYGHDVVFSRVAPEKEFDMLNEDFNYVYLIGSVIIAFIALITIKRMALKSKVLRVFNS